MATTAVVVSWPWRRGVPLDPRRARIEADGQRPLPFVGGLPAARRKPARAWRYLDGQRAKVCPVCGCSEWERCTLTIDGGTAQCVPAGVFGSRVCSGCKQPSLPFGSAEA